MIALCQNGPIILMLANRKIKKGEETLYNYNGVFDSYDTEAYEWSDIYSIFLAILKECFSRNNSVL